jgi:hypothetical protein
MSLIAAALARIREQPTPPEPNNNPFQLDSVLEPAASRAEVEQAWPSGVGEPLVELWLTTRAGRLFVDVDYGQWGLVLLSPADSAARTAKERARRPGEVEATDVVVGEFLGDQELVLVTGEGRVLIALPLDGRSDWYAAAADLGEFLDAYWRHGGDKFWESRSS